MKIVVKDKKKDAVTEAPATKEPQTEKKIENEVPAEVKPSSSTSIIKEAKQLQDQDVRFVCKICRNLLFDLRNIQPHTEGEKKELKGRTKVEADQCQLIFLNEMGWMNISSAETQGKITCPDCDCKLGKWNRTEGLSCSCGNHFQPAFSIKRRSINVMLPSDKVDGHPDLDDELNTKDDEDDQKKKKKAKAKKVKKQGNNSNLSSFRNKSFNVNRGSRSKAAADSKNAESQPANVDSASDSDD